MRTDKSRFFRKKIITSRVSGVIGDRYEKYSYEINNTIFKESDGRRRFIINLLFLIAFI